MINIAVKMSDSPYPQSSDLTTTLLIKTVFQPSLCLISSLTVLLNDSSYNLGDNLGSLPTLPYTHNQSLRGTDLEERSVLRISISLP